MAVRLLPETESRITRAFELGAYGSPDDVVVEALQLLEARDAHERLKAAINIGLEQIERGEVVEWSDDFLDELEREADREDELGLPIPADVRP